MAEQFNLELTTPAGVLTASVDVPTGFVPVTSIVPLMRRLGEEAHALDVRRAREDGEEVSCKKGCAACCRMLVPVSAPEAFALAEALTRMPSDQRQKILERVAALQARLEETGLMEGLTAVAEAGRPLTDEDLEPLNHAYYALQLPCAFLEDEACTIYEERPMACRELLVSTAPQLCADLPNQPVRALPVPLRIGTVLGLLWAQLRKEAPRLIPLPIALRWAETHRDDGEAKWGGQALLEQSLQQASAFLQQEFATRAQGLDK